MIPNANANHFRIKAAQRDLIAAAGGIERAAEIASYGKSTVGRWFNADSPEIMPVDAALRLEEETGRYDFLTALAAVRGRKLADGEGKGAETGDIMARFSDVMRQVGELSQSAAVAFADGKITPTEATAMIDKPASLLIEAANELRRAAATVRGAGGFSVVTGGAG
ncbi:phage regulatory CII family protein [Chelativorans sp.]|uniref:phage regulatory CII family protein n=1 Tax=Chelativorans sp. TaxID=2203393 RepID=UPI0028119F17|nr:phage regulatory CII family protein [Chelativorans sp.]